MFFTSLAATTSPAQETTAHPTDQWLDGMAELFEFHPERKVTRGTGWNPYNRIRWFTDLTRDADGRLPEPGAAQLALDERRRQLDRTQRQGGGWFTEGPFQRSGRILDVAPNFSGDVVYAASAGGGLWRSTDEGAFWTPLTDDLDSPAIGAVALDVYDNSIVIIGTGEGNPNAYAIDGIGILRSTDAGDTWAATNVAFPRGSGVGFNFVRSSNTPGVHMAGAYNRILNMGLLYRSADEGATWTQIGAITDEPFDLRWGWADSTAYLAVGDRTLGGTEILKSTDAGQTWTSSATGVPLDAANTVLATFPSDEPETIFAHISTGAAGGYSSRGIYRSTDAGASFHAQNTTTNIAGGQGWYNLSIAVRQSAPQANHVLAGGVRTWLSYDSGVHFVETGTSEDGLGSATTLHVDNHALEWAEYTDDLWAATDGGLWRSPGGNGSWESRNHELITYQFYDICVGQNGPLVAAGGAQDNGTPTRLSSDWEPSNPAFGDGMVCNIDPSNAARIYGESQFGAHERTTDAAASWTSIVSGLTGAGRWVTPVDLDPTDANVLFTETTDGIFKTTDSGNNWNRVALHRAAWIAVSHRPNIVWTVNDDGGRPRVSHGSGTTGSWSATSPYGLASTLR